MSALKQTVRDLESRLGAVETEQADASWRAAVQKHKADRWSQTLEWVLEGTKRVNTQLHRQGMSAQIYGLTYGAPKKNVHSSSTFGR